MANMPNPFDVQKDAGEGSYLPPLVESGAALGATSAQPAQLSPAAAALIAAGKTLDARWLAAQSAPLLAVAGGQPTVTVDSVGPVAMLYTALESGSYEYVEQPTGAVFLPNGNLAVAFHSVAATGSYGKVKLGIYSVTVDAPNGVTLTPVVAPAVVASDPVLDTRQPMLTLLADGRLLLVTPSNPTLGDPCGMQNGTAASGVSQVAATITGIAGAVLTVTSGNDYGGVNPLYRNIDPGMYVVPSAAYPAGTTVISTSGNQITLSVAPVGTPTTVAFYATNPDGQSGNIRYQLGTITGNSIAWGSVITIPTGFSVTAGFDYVGAGPAIEPVTGTIVLPCCGSQTTQQWSEADAVGYIVGTYAPNGSITWGSFVQGPATLANSCWNEPSVVVDNAGTWHMTLRENIGDGGSTVAAGIYHATSPTPTGSNYSTPTWSAAALIGTTLASQPSLTKLTSGTLVFPSRTGNTRFASLGYLASSANNGSTWQIQPIDLNVAMGWTRYQYGRVVEIPSQPGVALCLFAMLNAASPVESAIMARAVVDGAGISPFGAVHGVAGAFQTLRATRAVIDQIVVGPTGPNTFGGTTFPNWEEANVLQELQSPAGVLTDYPLYIPGRPLPEYVDLRTDVSMVWQNFPRTAAAVDSGGALFTAGDMYLMRLDWIDAQAYKSGAFWRYLYLESGATAQPTAAHAWAVLLTAPQTALAKIIATADVTTGFTANGQMKFDFGSAQSLSTESGQLYLGLVFTGTPPSVLGKTLAPQVALRAPFIAGNSSTNGTGLTTPGAFTGPAGAPSVGGGFLPWVGLSVN